VEASRKETVERATLKWKFTVKMDLKEAAWFSEEEQI